MKRNHKRRKLKEKEDVRKKEYHHDDCDKQEKCLFRVIVRIISRHTQLYHGLRVYRIHDDIFLDSVIWLLYSYDILPYYIFLFN